MSAHRHAARDITNEHLTWCGRGRGGRIGQSQRLQSERNPVRHSGRSDGTDFQNRAPQAHSRSSGEGFQDSFGECGDPRFHGMLLGHELNHHQEMDDQVFCEVPALAAAGADHSLTSSLSHLDRWNLRKAPREHTVYQNDLLSGLGPKTHPDLRCVHRKSRHGQ